MKATKIKTLFDIVDFNYGILAVYLSYEVQLWNVETTEMKCNVQLHVAYISIQGNDHLILICKMDVFSTRGRTKLEK